jgi:predicted transcriptional regulator
LLALVVSLIGLSTTGIIDNWQQRGHIDRTKEEIMKMLGSNHPMSFEQIYGNLNYVDYSTAAQAVDELVDENLVNHAKLSVTSESGKKYEVRVYNYSAFPIN